MGRLQNRACRRLAESLIASEVSLAAAWPFVNARPESSQAFFGFAQAERLEKEGTVNKTDLAALRALLNLEAGIWPRSGEWLTAESPQALGSDEDPRGSSAAQYAAWLLEVRRGTWSFPENDIFLRRLPQDKFGSLARSLLAELCLLSRQLTVAQQGVEKLSLSPYLWLQGEPEELPNRWRLLLSLQLETEQKQPALKTLSLAQNFVLQHHLGADLTAELKALAGFLHTGGNDFPQEDELVLPTEGGCSETQLRLKLATLGQQSLSDEADGQMWAVVERAAGRYRQIGGDALFDWLLRRVAWCLQKGDIQGAYELCEQLQERQLACLFAYLPRIYFLQAGLLLLNEQTAGLSDAYHALRFGSMASEEQELRVLEQSRGGEVQIMTGEITQSGEPYFWLEWLRVCQNLGRRQGNPGEEAVFSFPPPPPSSFNAEKALLSSLEIYSRTFLPAVSGEGK